MASSTKWTLRGALGAALTRRPKPPAAVIDDSSWKRLLAQYPFARGVGEHRLDRLRQLCNGFLASKTFAGEAGLVVDDHVGAAIALQACLPIIELGLDWYRDFDQIIVYPDQFLVPRREVDEAGVVHEESAWLAGETMDGGPVVLSWADVRAGAADVNATIDSEADDRGGGTFNVVIHEFVHKLDLRDGVADGVPPLPAGRRRAWLQALEQSFDHFQQMLDRVEASIPRSVDPDSAEADAYYDHLPLDSYAAQDPAEFFAVAGEAFFLDPGRLAAAYPALFHCFEQFFGVTPLPPEDAVGADSTTVDPTVDSSVDPIVNRPVGRLD